MKEHRGNYWLVLTAHCGALLTRLLTPQAESTGSCPTMANHWYVFWRLFRGLLFSVKLAVLGGVLAVPYTRNPLQRG